MLLTHKQRLVNKRQIVACHVTSSLHLPRADLPANEQRFSSCSSLYIFVLCAIGSFSCWVCLVCWICLVSLQTFTLQCNVKFALCTVNAVQFCSTQKGAVCCVKCDCSFNANARCVCCVCALRWVIAVRKVRCKLCVAQFFVWKKNFFALRCVALLFFSFLLFSFCWLFSVRKARVSVQKVQRQQKSLGAKFCLVSTKAELFVSTQQFGKHKSC